MKKSNQPPRSSRPAVDPPSRPILQRTAPGGLCLAREPGSPSTISLAAGFLRSIKRLPNSLSRIDVYLLLVIPLPLLVLLFDSNVFFSRAGWLDPWFYFSYFRHLREFESVLFPGAYYGSRLSWLLPGWFIHRLFAPVAANYVLHLLVCYAAALSLYYTCNYFYGRRCAGLSTAAFICNPYLWGAVGTDYVDGPGIACYLLIFAFLTRSSDKDGRLSLVIAGAAYAALVYTNIVWLVFSPAFPLYALFLKRTTGLPNRIRAAVHFALWFTVGALALSAVLGVINYGLDGRFWFYLPSVAFTLSNANKPSPFKAKTYSWVGHAEWLAYASIAVLAGGIYWIRRLITSRREWARGTVFFQVHLVAFFAIMVLLELKGLYFLQYAYYASYLIPATFLAFGSQLFNSLDESRHVGGFVVAGSVMLLVPWSAAGPLIWTRLSHVGGPIVVALAIGGILLRASLPRNRVALAACITGMSLLNLYFMATTGQLAERRDRPCAARSEFARITRSMDVIDGARQGGRILFWFNKNDANHNEFDSINALFLWGYTWIGREFPLIDPAANDRVKPGRVIAILSSTGESGDLVRQANEAMAPRGLAVSLRSRSEINYRGVHYGITCVNLEKATTKAGSPKLMSSKPAL